MKTVFKLVFERNPDIEIRKFQSSLPPIFFIREETDGIYIEIESDSEEDNRCQRLIDRELDRHFFLTCVKIRAEMIRKIVSLSLDVRFRIHGSLPDDIHPQEWKYELPIQLRLWSVAVDHNDILTKLLLLFQIIELSYPDTSNPQFYPVYDNSTSPPAPRSECKFIRHLIAHAGDVKTKQLEHYCAYLNLPTVMLDRTDEGYYEIIASKLPLMEQEAKKVIEEAL
jgi:hypothetical protein